MFLFLHLVHNNDPPYPFLLHGLHVTYYANLFSVTFIWVQFRAEKHIHVFSAVRGNQMTCRRCTGFLVNVLSLSVTILLLSV
jgi:hypothetical protein